MQPIAAHAGVRLPSLTSLRWFAASVVFLRHGFVFFWGSPLAATYAYVSPQGAVGVSFFFILSGFVLAWTYRPEPARSFYRRRIARVVPAYMVAVALGVGYVAVFQRARGTTYLLEAIFPATLLQSWVPNSGVYFGNAAALWSLSTEVFFYALFPLIIGPVMRLQVGGLIRLLACAAVISISIPLLLRPNTDGLAYWAIYINPVYRLMEFVIGLCLCGLIIKGVRLRIPLAPIVGLALMAYLLAGQVPSYAMWVAVTLIPFAALIFAFAEADLEGRATFLHRPTLIRLGQWSFAFYLLHSFVIHTFQLLHVPAGSGWQLALWTVSYPASIVAAYFLYRFVEHPLERWIRHGGTATPPDELRAAPRIAPS